MLRVCLISVLWKKIVSWAVFCIKACSLRNSRLDSWLGGGVKSSSCTISCIILEMSKCWSCTKSLHPLLHSYACLLCLLNTISSMFQALFSKCWTNIHSLNSYRAPRNRLLFVCIWGNWRKKYPVPCQDPIAGGKTGHLAKKDSLYSL